MNNKPFNNEDFLADDIAEQATCKESHCVQPVDEIPYKHPIYRIAWIVGGSVLSNLHPALLMVGLFVVVYQFFYLIANLVTYFEHRATTKERKQATKELTSSKRNVTKQLDVISKQLANGTFGTAPLDKVDLLQKIGLTILGIFALLAYGMPVAKANPISKIEQLANSMGEVRYCTIAYKENTPYPVWKEYVGLCLPELTKAVNACEALYLTPEGVEHCKKYTYQVSLTTYQRTNFLGK